MGVVYLAEDTILDRQVAIKFLPHHIAGNPTERERFKVEAKAAAALNHPNITTIHAVEQTDEELFIVMEYIEGNELKELINSDISPFSRGGLRGVLDIAIQIAAGLEAAHKKGIIHRDIKSTNIMVTNSGIVKLMDFGLAKLRGAAHLTRIGTTVGTAAYMSPEQAKGEEADERSDIWSLGVVLYEMLTGQMPFKGEYEQAVIYSILNEPPEPVSDTLGAKSPGLQSVIEKCLQKDRNYRYQNVAELLNDLSAVKNDQAAEIMHTPISQKRKNPARASASGYKKFAVAGGLVATVMILALIPFSREHFSSLFRQNPATNEKHVLILPFSNIGGDVNNQAFCDGLMETLSSKLTQIEQFQGTLWVVPASEVIQHNVKSISDAQQMYGANLAITGSLQFMNNIFRLTLNLVDAKNLRQLNSAIIDVNARELTSLHDRAVIHLMEMLHIELDPKSKDILMAGNTTVPAAYEYYVRGKGFLQRYENAENIDEAIRLFKLATESDNSYALAFAGLGEAYWRDYEITKKNDLVELAVNEAEKAFRLDSLLSPVNITLGIIYSGIGQYDKAINQFKQALSGDPSNAAAYRGLARAYESTEKVAEAELTYKRAIGLKPDYWAGYNDLGVFYFRNSRYEDAIQQFKQVIKITPDNYRGYNNLGGIYYMLERWKDARNMFEKSLAIRKSYNIYSNLGTLYYIESKYEKAAGMYEQALEINKNDYLTWGNLAATYELISGKQARANQLYRQAIAMAEEQLTINPHDADVISNLASYYADVGDSLKSITLLTQSIEMASDDIQVMYRAGSTYEHLGNREQALLWIGRALKNGYSRSEIENQPELAQLVADKRYKQLTVDKK